jgi:hypothetical protein
MRLACYVKTVLIRWNCVSQIAFMDMHDIEVSVLSLANPWLEFMKGKAAVDAATALNEDLQELCVAHPTRFLGFGVIPMDNPDAACKVRSSRLRRGFRTAGSCHRAHRRGRGCACACACVCVGAGAHSQARQAARRDPKRTRAGRPAHAAGVRDR